ncbi:hypothetical protein GCM10027596_26690 [Nocardioides korecus]
MAAGTRVGFKVTGLTQLVRDLKALGLDVDDLKDAFSAIADEGAKAVSRHVPRRSGRLAASVRGNRAQSKAVVAAGRAAVPYAGPINYGWPSRGIAAAGFMQKADDEMRPKAVELLEQNINAQIQKRGLA